MERIVIGMLAHVDAGKTTLSEALLFKSGTTRNLGRVDHRDAFLDTHKIERERGITIFSKQAQLTIGDKLVTLMDTPGHVDFSTEAERVLRALDYAILVVSAADGVQTHTLTLWKLLKRHHTPVFIFVNKMDLPCPERSEIMNKLKAALDGACVDFTEAESLRNEDIATCDEGLMEAFLQSGRLSDARIMSAVRHGLVYPVYFGSALKLEGVEELMNGIAAYTSMPDYPKDFGARVIKITHSEGTRLTFMKITGGRLAAKQIVTNRSATVSENDVWEEKADQLRLYSGAKYIAAQEVLAGSVVAVTGLTRTYAGEGLGIEAGVSQSCLSPVLSYSLKLAENDKATVYEAYRRISILREEDPQLGIEWDDANSEIKVHLMGEIQCEVLRRIILERFGLSVDFGPGAVMYRETIADAVEGIGHFEPLRHFAHVELRLEPLPPNSGIQLETELPQNELSRNWQRQILSQLAEKKHRGVLTGSPLTDVRIILTGGKAHIKHTEGGDFRQAACRAVRNALMFAQNVLLEPYYQFSLEVPDECIGRAMSDIKRMEGEFGLPEKQGELSVINGEAPVSEIMYYAKDVAAYTHGRGKISFESAMYKPCHNARTVIESRDYSPEADLDNSPDSVFCAAGAGFTVKWFDVAAYMKRAKSSPNEKMPTAKPKRGDYDEEAELQAIFERTYGTADRSLFRQSKKAVRQIDDAPREIGEEYILVDGYNVIFAWESLRRVAADSIDSAREALIRMMINYAALRKTTLILVFDAYKVTGGRESVENDGGIYIVYTRESEIADVFIERAVRKLSDSKKNIRVVTSDGLEQLIVMGKGALRVPASAFEKEVSLSNESLSNMMQKLRTEGKTVLHLWQKLAQKNDEDSIHFGANSTVVE